MKVKQINRALSLGEIREPGIFPHLEGLKEVPFIFRVAFGLDELPKQEGVILIRGARQYGKSTWLEGQIQQTIERFGPGTAYYLNGDELPDDRALGEAIRELLPLFGPRAKVRRLFIDEITAIDRWEKALKILLDAGELRGVLVVTTGSRAADLRRGSERLPGRKGKLKRTAYLFTPLSFREFSRVAKASLGKNVLPAYILSGGSPVACGELAARGRIPEYVIEMTRDWLCGEFARTGRGRAPLTAVCQCIHRFAATPVGQAKLAREAGLANNTAASQYIELLMDLLCVASAWPWDEARRRANRRRPCKFHFINLLAAVAWGPERIRSIRDYQNLPTQEQGKMIEWLIAQELWRRAAIRGEDCPEEMLFWQSKANEINFVLTDETFLEVKSGRCSPMDFTWFQKSFSKGKLNVINPRRFSTQRVTGITLKDFLLDE